MGKWGPAWGFRAKGGKGQMSVVGGMGQWWPGEMVGEDGLSDLEGGEQM